MRNNDIDLVYTAENMPRKFFVLSPHVKGIT